MRTGIEGYDERQRVLRHKFGYQAFFVSMGLGFFNAWFCEFIYAWGSPMVTQFIVIMLSAYYFGLRTVLSGAYTGDAASERRTAVILPIVCGGIVLLFLSVLTFVVSGHLSLIEDGRATVHLFSVINPVFIVPLTLAYYIKRYRDKRNGEPN
ncbi:MAG: hypothetical protein FWG72_07990 [Oscillospiraceae bacterium]|nr:hypothetical protein [Oscillospiraceae bacterium]